MFDFRYHAVSLAAVLVALVVGLLLGVAIGDANLVSNAEHGLANSLQGKVDAAAATEGQLRAQLATRSRYEQAAYPALVAGRLAGKHIGLVFLGGTPGQMDQQVRAAIAPAGGSVTQLRVREPPDLTAIAGSVPGYGVIATDPALLRRYGFHLGRQLVRGQGTLLHDVQGNALDYNGTLGKLDGIVLVRSDASADPATQQTIDNFDSAFAAGMTSTKAPVIGAETSTTNPSTIPWFTQQNLTSVDNVDDIAGQTALVFALEGSQQGSYGMKGSAQGILPPLTSTTGPAVKP